jgi:hypothetical protein
MALNVNGYNDTFQNFVDFAKIHNGMGEKTAIARVTTGRRRENGGWGDNGMAKFLLQNFCHG